jgi:hypothetical protein
MGKRELLIIAVFVVIGVAAYQLTAPPETGNSRGFSIGRLIDHVRREVRGNNAQASITRRDHIDAPATLTELRISGVTGLVTVTGEDRADISYELQIGSSGPDTQTATQYAEKTIVKRDELGSTVAIRVSYPREARQTSTMQVRVPSRLAVRLEGGNRAEVTGVATLHLESVIGDVTVRGVARSVSGSHRNGTLVVSAAGSISMTINGSSARFEKIAGAITLNARGGEVTIDQSLGAIELDENNEEITINGPAGPVRVSGNGGRIVIDGPRQEVRIDVRRAEVELTLREAAPLTVLTTEEPLRLIIAGTPSVVVDAIATDGGSISAGDFGLTPETIESESRVSTTMGAANGARVGLRNQRGDIVIRRAK